jgi:peptide/nickel transport system permease protein
VLLVMIATFSIVRLVPGDVVEIILAENPYATEADKDRVRKVLGLDKPMPIQFVNYTADVLRGDLGYSPWTQREVRTEIKNRLPVTMELGIYSVLIGMVIAIPVGIIAAIRQDTMLDYFSRSFAILALSVPYFFTAVLLVVLPVVWFGWSPPLKFVGWSESPFGHLYFFFWPALLLGIASSGSVMRMTRTMMLEVMRQDYIRTAHSKGLTERTVVLKHAMKNAMIPVITIIGLQVGLAISGTLILETIFNMPGMGRYFIGAIFARDYWSIQGVVLVLAVVTVSVNLIVDVMYGVLDPRIRYS